MVKTILVAGGAGFIGSHLCKKLLDSGEYVICLDNLSTGDKGNILPFFEKKNFQFIHTDTRQLNLSELLPADIQEIYDLASPASVTYICDHPIEAATVNGRGTKNLLDLSREQTSKFLFASSSEVYGDPREHPQKESYWGNVNPVGIRSGYDEGKRFGEALCMAYHREALVNVKIARIFNTYGPNSSPEDSRVIPRFVTQALRNNALTVHGDGTQTRSMCYVSDMVDGLISMMASEQTGPINLGNPEEYQIIDIVKKIIEMTKSSSKIIFTKRPIDDPALRRPDIALAKSQLDFSPKISFEKGLKKTIDYFKGIISQ